MGYPAGHICSTAALMVGMIVASGCVEPEAKVTSPSTEPVVSLPEQSIISLPLAGPINPPEAEISGMAWFGDHLVILPQYPERFALEDVPQLFMLPKSAIVETLAGHSASLEPIAVPLRTPDFRASIPGFQGFEAIGFAGDQVFLTIEADTGESTAGYLVRGQVIGDLERLEIQPGAIVSIPSQSGLGNMAEESLVVTDDGVLTLHEVNGAALNPDPVAYRFSRELEPLGALTFPALEYRVTDATVIDGEGTFWVMNYFFPGDSHLKPAQDPLAQTYGVGPTHAEQETVERIIALQYDGERITRKALPPTLLALAEQGRNWEAIVRLDDRGFLVMTDKFPETILGFVPDTPIQE